MHRIRMLQHYGVQPYVVFDGGHLPSKRHTEAERSARRREAHARGLELLGARRMSEARDAFVRSIDISPQMAHELIKALRQAGIPYIVAPYEADAQLAFLERVGLIDGIITEDSDLLVFGCNTVLFKLDTYGNCVEVQRSRFAEVKQVALDGWGIKEFRQLAILSGCDYLPSIAGMGLRVAHRLLRRYETAEHVLRAVRLEGKMSVPPAYEENFRRAELTFAHQRVWDPRGDGMLTTLEPLPPSLADDLVPFIGELLPTELARAVACGNIDPITRMPIEHAAPPPATRTQPSIHSFFRRPLAARDTNVPSAPPADPAAKPTKPAKPADASSRSSSPADVFDVFCARSSSPVHTPPASPKRAPHDDGVVSSPVSSPASSPVRVPAKRPAEVLDAERRRDWHERFTFSGTRPRHVALPGTTPPSLRAPVRRVVSETTPTRRSLHLTQRSTTTPTPTLRPSRGTPTPGSGAARLLKFRYTEPATPT